MTIAEALDVSKRSVSFREAEIFLAHVLGRSRAQLHAHPETALTDTEVERYERCLARRETNEPVAYITGSKEFYGRPFICDARALIPRPETEGLIDQALEILPDRFRSHLKATNKPCPVRILELGTGCGNIAATLSLELAQRSVPADIVATDISAEALKLAEENGIRLGAQHIQWTQADLFDAAAIREHQPFDLIIANLPYVPATWRTDPRAQPDVVFYEPDISLFGGEDGLDIYRRFFTEIKGYVKPDGHILIEYNEDQTNKILEIIASTLIGANTTVRQDYAGLDRTIRIDLYQQ